jgi:hypothetical protein
MTEADELAYEESQRAQDFDILSEDDLAGLDAVTSDEESAAEEGEDVRYP